jgi:hypothetical protein
MIDQGLVLTVVAMAAVVGVVIHLAPPRTLPAAGVFDATVWALLGGLLAGRVVAMALDDPSGLTRVGDIVILRGGVEFWPGLAVGSGIAALTARGETPVLTRLADLAPYGLAAYAVYEAACVVRDGCFGPASPLGLRPGGVGEPQFPVALVVALVVVPVGVAVRHLGLRSPSNALLAAVGGLAAVLWVAAFWLPRIGSGPTRQQTTSLVVVLSVCLGAAALRWVRPTGSFAGQRAGPS